MNFDRPARSGIGSWLALSTVMFGCFGVLEPGCGGDNSSLPGPEDSGSDAIATGDTTMPPPPEDAGDSATPPPDGTTSDAAPDSAPGDASEDSSKGPDAAPTDAGEDSPSTPDAGRDGESSEAGLDAESEAGLDAQSEAGRDAEAGVACTGSETACTLGATAGLCVSGSCAACNSPADNAHCTAAYGAGTTSYVCDSAGSCVPGNCNADADCSGASAGEICGLTTANVCGKCVNDGQCQGDANYGAGTICNTTTGACVAATCTANSSACGANTSDFCCGLTCVPGNCCTNADCATSSVGPVCGAGTPHVCGKCTADSQCASGQVCNTSTGNCVTNSGLCTGAPGATGGAAGTCTNIGSDICCNAGTCFAGPGGSSIACCPGAAGTTYCQGQLGDTRATCAGNACTTCAPISTTTPIYYVDPVHGSDNGTGSLTLTGGGTSDACALKTITRALQIIGTAVVPTEIVVVGGAVGAGETFPIPVPTNVTISTQTAAVTVNVPSGRAGFTMSAPNAQITSGSGAPLTITTTVTGGFGGTNGIVVGAGSAATTQVSNVTITGMINNGILVNGGALTIGQGVVASKNGTAVRNGNGLSVQGGEAIISVTSGTATTFNSNSAHGILVGGSGFIHLTGSVTSAASGTGTVETNANTLAGVWIQQAAGAPQNVISGLVSFGNTAGNGMRIVGGSNVQVRNSAFLGNSNNGVIVSTGTGANANSLAGIDLGTSGTGGSNGGNTFQASLGSGNNGGAGICLAVAANSGTLNAAGNTFHAATCTSGSPTLTLNNGGCANSATLCTGGVCDLGENNATGNTFDVATCAP
jgi:hypothetical protein